MYDQYYLQNFELVCEISSSHGDEYDVQSCLLGCTIDNHFTRQYNPEDSFELVCFKSVFKLLEKDSIPVVRLYT
jgi:hypothetical protein